MSSRLVLGAATVVAVVLAVGLWLLLTREPVNSGRVVDHRFTAAHTTTTLIPQYITTCSGNPPICTPKLSYFLPVTNFHPDRWELRIDPPGERDPEWITVTQSDHDRYDFGEPWRR